MEIFTSPTIYCFSMYTQEVIEIVQLIGFYFDETKKCKGSADYVKHHDWEDEDRLNAIYPMAIKLK